MAGCSTHLKDVQEELGEGLVDDFVDIQVIVGDSLVCRSYGINPRNDCLIEVNPGVPEGSDSGLCLCFPVLGVQDPVNKCVYRPPE